YFSTFCNTIFWRQVAAAGVFHQPGGMLAGISLFVAMTALTTALLCLALYRWTAKPLLTVLFVATALATYYMEQFTVYLNPEMIRNILHTDQRESLELLSTGMILPLLLHAVLPIAVLWWVRLKPTPGVRGWLLRGGSIVAALLVSVLAIGVSYQNVSSLMRNHPHLRYLVTPGNYLVSLARVAVDDGRPHARLPVGLDARVDVRPAGSKPRLLVIVVGETVRAQNWGLNGYHRNTTPELARIGVLNFPEVHACGSSTEVSVPCMFSAGGRHDYDAKRIKRSQSLLHVLDHAGIASQWRDNQGGCKGVCEGLPFESFANAEVKGQCGRGGCLDEVMLDGLQRKIQDTPGDLVIVLHQMGNHGPSYFLRYPPDQAPFQPACTTPELARCSQQEIINAYDNAVLQTDRFVASTIHLLEADDSHDDALVYVSDHGESLGEHGLYLHGLPYALAPETQLRVPMVMWLSPGMAGNRGIDMGCMQRQAAKPASHDNLFHSVLGLMQVRTTVYAPSLDLFAACEQAMPMTVSPTGG
ncbi:MAG: phosphoethanolamine--lipid A transferase, partial [Luteimonas sp.]